MPGRGAARRLIASWPVPSGSVSDGVTDMLDLLRADGSRITASRIAVVEAIVGGGRHHLTAVDLLASLRQGGVDLPESTVYRTLDRLVDVGALTRIEVDGSTAVYHVGTSAHHHVVCDRCGRVYGIDASVLRSVADRLRVDHRFVLRAEAVTLPGRCIDCDDDHPDDVGGHQHGR